MEASDETMTEGNSYGEGEEFEEGCVEAKEYENGETRSAKMEMYEKRLGAADTSGQDYEVGICMLLFLRGLRHCPDFCLASNHGRAGDFDDAVFVYKDVGQEHYNAVLVQMKHKRRSKISHRSLTSYKNDFSVRKYFRSFMASRDFWRSFEVDGAVGPLKEVSYVLYSNAAADSRLPGTEVVDPSFAHLLCTRGKCVRFRYEDVADAFSDDSDSHIVDSAVLSQRHEFLESFVLCHSQGSQRDLEICIGEEIRHLLWCSDGDVSGITEKLKGGIKSWWANNESQTFYVRRNFPIWRKILKSRVERFGEPYDSRELRIDLRFSESCMDKVRSLIRGSKQLALLVGDHHEARLACSKVQKAVRSDCLAVVVDIFKTNAEEIENLSRLQAFNTLVVIALDGLSQSYDKLLQGIAGTVAGGVVLICRETTETWNKECGRTGFHDLEVTSADQILERVINLQGSKFRLKDLTANVADLTSRLNASHLIELSCDDTKVDPMGQVLDDPIPYFVSRRLTRRKLLDKSFFSALKQNDETCVIVGEMDVLRHLRLRRGFSQEGFETSPQTYKGDCIVILSEDAANDVFHKMSGENPRTRCVHMVKYIDGKFFWLKSRGDETTVLKHVITEEMSCLFDNEDSEIIINGSAGSGKSAWMEYFAVNRNGKPVWVVKVDVTETSITESNFDNEEKIKAFLLERCSSSGRRPGNLEDMLLSYALDVSGNVIIFVDKLDVLNTRYAEHVFQFLSIITKVKHSKLVVATIPSEKDKVEKVLETFAYDLEPFAYNEKRQFLRNFLRFKGVDYGADEAAKIEAVVEKSEDCLSSPLMAYVTAQMTFLSSVRPGDQLKLKPTPQLYSMLVEEELKLLLEAKNGLKEYSPSDGEVFQFYKKSLFEELMKLAATIFIPEDQLKQRNCKLSSEKLLNSRFGLLVCKDSNVHFLHISFAEYFFALWLKSNDSDKDLLKENLFKSNAAFVRQCFGSFYLDQHDLHAAVADEDVERVATLLHLKDETDAAGRTALHVAAMSASTSSRRIAQLLIEVGVRIDAVDSLMNCNALQFALAAANWGVADLLLATEHFRGSKYARKLVGRFENCKAVFSNICRLGYVELARCMVKLDAGLLTETYGDGKDSTLHLAAESGSTELVEWILERGVKVSVNSDGQTPASVAAREGHVDILRILRDNGVSLDQADTARPLHSAALNNHEDAVNYLICEGVDVEAQGSNNETALHCSSREGHVEVVRLLLVVGKARVNSVNGSLETPLHCAALRGRTSVVEALLDAGADEDARNSSHETPLHYAANRGEIGVIDVLVSRGADLSARNAKGRTPLHCAARYKHINVVNTLIRAGASVDAKDEDGATPLHHAAWEGASKNDAYLLRRLWSGESVRPDDAYQALSHNVIPPGTRDVVEALLVAGADVNAVDKQQLTPATYSRDETVRRMLQGDGADDDDDDDLARFSLTRLPGCRSGVVI